MLNYNDAKKFDIFVTFTFYIDVTRTNGQFF